MTQEVMIFDVWRKQEGVGHRGHGDQYLGLRLARKINEFLALHRGHRIKSIEYILDSHLTISKPHQDVQRSALVVFDVIKELEV